MTDIQRVIENNGFRVCKEKVEAPKEEQNVSYDDLHLCDTAINFLKKSTISSLWSHQYEAIHLAKQGHNVCVTTSTSSGKTQIFQIAAMESLSQIPGSKVLAIYPMKALGSQQVDRWKKSGLRIGIIDGNHIDNRKEQLETSDVLVMTPDVVHTFLLGRLNDSRIGNCLKSFISHISMIIIDELHLYKGFFGTNAAFLFRRLNNVRRLLTGRQNDLPQYITASATLPNAPEHSFNITGAKNFIEIGIEKDGSPARPKHFLFIENNTADGTSKSRNEKISDLVLELSKLDNTRSITFVDSRQSTDQMAFQSLTSNAEDTGIYPYRSGYEDKARETITEHLENDFKGVVSTSALEIGIDIDGLNVVIIADMPHDKNSYQQRIGRVGRYGCEGDSYVIIVKDENSFASNLLFGEYDYDMDKALPNYEPALYLEDKNIQYVHALCHIGDTEECEYSDWKGTVGRHRTFNDGGCFPASFVNLCNDILAGSLPEAYEKLEEASEHPHYEFAIRFFGDQYQIEDQHGSPIDKPISRLQVTTEGYKGAIRSTVRTIQGVERLRHRIKSIDFKERPKKIIVQEERNKSITKTTAYKRTYLIPNFSYGLNASMNCGNTAIYNLRTYEHISIWGYYEYNRNGSRKYIKYPQVFQMPRLITTGTLFFHPSFNAVGVNVDQIAHILFEAFLRRNAFDRNDISYYGGRLFSGNSKHAVGERFIALYDASSINLTKSITSTDKLSDLFIFLQNHLDVISKSIYPDIGDNTVRALKDICEDFEKETIEINEAQPIIERHYKSGTMVLLRLRDNQDPLNEEKIQNKPAIYLGKGENELVNLFVDGEPIFNIDNNDVYPIEGQTQYV